MANSNTNPTTTPPPVAVPGNLKGTLAGAVAALGTAALVKTGIFASAAALLEGTGMSSLVATGLVACGIPVVSTQPEVLLATVAAVAVGAAVNWGVTHYSGLKTCEEYYKMLPSTYAEYPNSGPAGTSTTNLTTKDGQKVNKDAKLEG